MADTPQIENKTEVEDELAGTEAPLLEHLVELRKRLIWSLMAFAVLFVLCFFVSKDIYLFLIGPFKQAVGDGGTVEMIFTAPQEQFFTQLSVAMFAAFALSFPVIAYQIYAFVAPGLYKNERKAFLPYIIATPILFLIGAALVYYGVMPLALRFFLSTQVAEDGVNIQMQTRVSEYLSLIMTLLLAFGVCFQLPVLLTLLARAELVTAKSLASWRKYAVVAILALAAFLTPPDPISQIGLALPLLLLYEVSILSVRWVERGRPQAETEPSEPTT